MPNHNERDAYLRECALRFASDLESVLKQDPLQWYNFYPFWEETTPPVVPPAKPTLCPSR
jgi:predicted LPLAT superfamily acyltransferase